MTIAELEESARLIEKMAAMEQAFNAQLAQKDAEIADLERQLEAATSKPAP